MSSTFLYKTMATAAPVPTLLNIITLIIFAAAAALPSQAKTTSSSKSNPADELATVINKNRTASKLNQLFTNPGLSCLSLQYIQAYNGQCERVKPDGEKPSKEEFRSTFAENCGVRPASVSEITGILLACESDFRDSNYAFSNLLFKDQESLQTLRGENQTEFGVGISGYGGGPPYFWCVVFSSGHPNSSFAFEQKTAKVQRTGCFSGTGEPCSSGSPVSRFWISVVLVSLVICGL